MAAQVEGRACYCELLYANGGIVILTVTFKFIPVKTKGVDYVPDVFTT
jgi:hypothetical protein